MKAAVCQGYAVRRSRWPASPAARRGVLQALAILHESRPITADERAEAEHALAHAHENQAQGDLPLALPIDRPMHRDGDS